MGLNQQIQGLWSSSHVREGQLNEAQKVKEQAHKELEEQTNLIKVMVRRNELYLYSDLIMYRKLE